VAEAIQEDEEAGYHSRKDSSSSWNEDQQDGRGVKKTLDWVNQTG
jgi:hypothetical protein